MKKLFAIAMLTMMSTSAFAIDFKTPIRQLDGKTIPISNEDKTPLTLGKACEDALIATLPGDSPTMDEKGNRFRLALKIHKGTDALSSEDVTLIKKVVGMAYGPLVVGRVIELLDPASAAPTK